MSTPCGCDDNQIITNCTEPAPTPPECVDGESCVEIVDAHCVQYTGENIPSINVVKNDKLDDILNKLVRDGETQAIETEDGNTISFTGSGLNSDKLSAEVKKSTEYDEGPNIVQLTRDGIYVPKGNSVVLAGDVSLDKSVGGVRIQMTGNNIVEQPVFDVKVNDSGAISEVVVIDGGVFSSAPAGSIVTSFGTGAQLSLVTTGTAPNLIISSVNIINGGSGYKNDHYVDVRANISSISNNQLKLKTDRTTDSENGLYVSPGALVPVSSTDENPNYLLDKLVEGDNVTLTKNNEGGDETITISVDVPSSLIVLDTATIDLDYTEGTLSANLKLDAKVLVTPAISPGFTYKKNDGSSDYTNNIPARQGYDDTDPKNPIVDVGASVGINGNYIWQVTNSSTQTAPTGQSGDFATGTVSQHNTSSTAANYTATITQNTTGTVTRSVSITAAKSGLYVVGNKVVAASGDDSTSASVSIRFKHKFYGGKSTSTIINDGDVIKNLSSRNFCDSGTVVNIPGVSTISTEYFYFCIPAAYTLSNIIKNDSLPILGAFTLLNTTSVTNDAGYVVSYKVYRSNAINPFSDTSKLSFYF